MRRDFHSTPDLANQEIFMSNGFSSKGHRSQEDVTQLGLNRNTLPPPNHPPPPPPVGQVIKVDISRGGGSEYDNLSNKDMSDEGELIRIFVHPHYVLFML